MIGCSSKNAFKVGDIEFSNQDVERVESILTATSNYTDTNYLSDFKSSKDNKEITSKVIDYMIDNEVVYQKAQSEGIKVDENDVEQKYNQIKTMLDANGDYKKSLEKANIDEAYLKETIKKDLVISLSGGNSVTVPIKVAAIGGSNGYKLIETVADLSEGKYFMAGYAEISNNKTDLKPYTYQIWQGTLSGSDLVTVAYQYQGDELIAKDASQVAAEMELVKIDGKADTYYIKIGDQYLYNPTKATNRKLKLKDTADESVEWKFEDKNNGGVTASNNEVYLVTADADSKFIRSYKSSSISSLKGIFFFKKK